MTLEGVEIVAIADNHEPSLKRAVQSVKNAGRQEPAAYGKGDEDYKRMLDRDDIDIVIIATPWELHARMCVDAMKAGKHAFTEVPAAVTLDECWQLVDTSEKTQKHCMMMENCCYGREELFCLNLCRLGLLGELLHGEGGLHPRVARPDERSRTRHRLLAHLALCQAQRQPLSDARPRAGGAVHGHQPRRPLRLPFVGGVARRWAARRSPSRTSRPTTSGTRSRSGTAAT